MSAFGRMPLSVSAGRSSSFLTYEPYYGLTEKPFSLAADPRFLFKSPSHAPIFDALLLGIRRREGLIVLTGDIGTGKTTLCRAVLDHLDRKTFSTFVPDPFVSREDLLKMLLIDFGVMSVDDLKSGRLNGATRAELSYPLYEFLKSLLPLQAFAVLIIDEAQNLPVPLLEEIRILSDLEAPEKLLQVVLVGQLELRSKLKLPEMRQVDQRVSARCDLGALTRDGVAGYITHRLAVAGGGTDRVRFSPDAIEAIHAASGGVPRLINLICDRVLYRGYLGRKTFIDAETVSLAVGDLGVGALTALDQGDRGAGAPTKKEAPLSREEMGDLDVKGLHDVRGRHEVKSPSHDTFGIGQALTALDSEPYWQDEEAERIDTEPDENVVARLWRRRPERWATFVALPCAVLLLVAIAQAGSAYLRPRLSAESVSFPEPPAAPRLLIKPSSLPSPPGVAPASAIVPAEPAAAAPIATAPSDGRRYAIDVALFQSAQNAGRLVEQLVAADYPAYQIEINLGARGQAYVVMVGAYQAPADAQTDLARVRQIPGHGDARIMAVPSRSVPQ